MNVKRIDSHEYTTCLIDTIEASYLRLVEAFGPPLKGDGDKVRVEWRLLIDDVPVSIYDWKRFESIEDVHTWNVGGLPGLRAATMSAVFAAMSGEP